MGHIKILILLISLSLDLGFAGLSLGANKINIPLISNILLNIIGTTILLVSLTVGQVIASYIPESLLLKISSFILILLGISKIFENIHRWIHKTKREIHIRFQRIEFILKINKSPEQADLDISKTISCKESILLAVAMSLDNLVAGFGVGLLKSSIGFIIFINFLIGCTLLQCSNCLGQYLSKHLTLNISWIAGIMLIIIGVLR